MAENVRTKNAVRNGLVSFGGYVVTFLLGILSRRIFLSNLSIINLGYEGLFTNVFSILSTMDMGAGTLFLYRVYQSVAAGDDLWTKKNIAMAARIYCVSTTLILLAGVAVMPFLKYIILDEISDWNYVYRIYVIQLIGTCGVGYLTYHRLLLLAYQRSSDIAVVELIVRIGVLILKILIIFWTKNYILYVAAAAAYGILSNVIIAVISRRRYGALYRGTCEMGDFQEAGFLSELKNISAIRLLNIPFQLTDTVLISAVLGLNTVGLYGNYTLIGFNVTGGIQAMLKPLFDGVANFMNTSERDQSYRLYQTIDCMIFFISSVTLTAFIVMFQPSIAFLFGSQYLLPLSFVVFYSLSRYLAIKSYSIMAFRSAIGEYRKERGWAIAASLVNLTVSIIGAKLWGIAGILLGSFSAALLIHIGYYSVTFQQFFHMPVLKEVLHSLLTLLLTCTETAAVYFLCNRLPVSFAGILIRALVCFAVPTLINIAVFRKTDGFKSAKMYMDRALRIIMERLRGKLSNG